MEASNYHDPIYLNFEEYSVWKPPHSSPATATVNDRKLQRTLCNCLNCCFHRQRETLT